MAARLVTVALTLAAGLLLWRAASVFGEWPALVTYALWCLSPSVLAHGSLATLDGWVTAFVCAVIWAGGRLFTRPTPAWGAALGACLAAGAASKATAMWLLPFVALLVIVAVRRPRPERVAARIAGVLAAVAGGLALTLFAVYGFRLGVLDTASFCGKPSGLPSHTFGPLPFAPWIEGMLAQWHHGRGGHLGYLWGQVGASGWWWFYLAVIALKTTIGAQLLALSRLVAWTKQRPTRRSLLVDASLLACPLALVAFMSAGQSAERPSLHPARAALRAAVARPRGGRPRSAFGGRGRLAAAAPSRRCRCFGVGPPSIRTTSCSSTGGREAPTGGPRYLYRGRRLGQDQPRLGEWQAGQDGIPDGSTRGVLGHAACMGINETSPRPASLKVGYFALQAVEVHRPLAGRTPGVWTG